MLAARSLWAIALLTMSTPRIFGMVSADCECKHLMPLTDERAKPAVPLVFDLERALARGFTLSDTEVTFLGKAVLGNP